jgi:hypothetical protein
MLVRMCGKGTFIHCWWECKLVQPLWKTVWRLLRELEIDLPYDLAISLLGIYPKNVSQVTVKAPAHPCLLQHYSQYLNYEHSKDALLLMNGSRKCGIYAQRNFIQL